MSVPQNQKSPWWFAVLLIIICVPALFMEAQAVKVMSDTGWIANDLTTWLFPAYIIISVFSAWLCFPNRRTLAWILFFLVVLTDLGLLLMYIV